MARPFIVSADWHAHNWSAFSTIIGTDKGGINSRLNDLLQELWSMAHQAKEVGAKRVFCAGDIFHVRGQVKPSVINPLRWTLVETARKFDIEWVLTPGNHDLETEETTALGSAILQLDDGEHGPVRVAQDIEVFEEEMVVTIPWYPTREKLDAALREARQAVDDPTEWTLLMHCGISGVIANVPGHFEARELAEQGFKRVLSGHYHSYQPFDIDGIDVISIGPPLHHSWSDVGTLPGFIVVGEDYWHRVDSGAPEFIDFSEVEDWSEIKGNYVRVRDVELTEAEIITLRENLVKEGAKAVLIQVAPKDKTVTRSETTTKSVSLESSIGAFVDHAGHSRPVLDVALDVLKEAQNV